MVQIVCTRVGMPSYERYLGPILRRPAPEIWADAEIDMRRESVEHPGKLWWLAVDPAGVVLAQCAAWPRHGDVEHPWECGHNYEHGHRDRPERLWPQVFAARQAWLIEQRITAAVTHVFDQPLGEHLAAGWTYTGKHDVSDHGHRWHELTWCL